ncbi:hypothetical protein SAMN04488000_118144 [Lentzea albida]|uniref:HTH cro/C1-type domain-containing protein n=2 Tax=Lentzea albida TaxID=65499 RepID=A0A1H9VIJ2_9PSEU|nr:hypothetical protein SAMN04488000_118144 [Lentzea albida]
MTQTDLARALKAEGLPYYQQTIQRIESGERPVRLNEAHVIARFFEVDMETMAESLLATGHEVLWTMDRVSSYATQVAMDAIEAYEAWLERVASFAASLMDLIDREQVNTFADLSPGGQVGLAFCRHVLSSSEILRQGHESLLKTFGDDSSETREDKWEFALPDDQVLHDIEEYQRRFDCPELTAMSSRSVVSLLVHLRVELDRASNSSTEAE